MWDPRKHDSIGGMSEGEASRLMRCEHCGYTWIPPRYKQIHVCRRCRQATLRDLKTLDFGLLEEDSVKKVREEYEPLDDSEAVQKLFGKSRTRLACAIYELCTDNRPCFAKALSDYIGINHQTVINYLREYEDAGLIERGWTSQARKEVSLTEKGRRILGMVSRVAREVESEWE